MPSQLSLHLLNNRPKVSFDGEDLHVPESSLDLLIYLAVDNQSEYDRDELTLRLYESLESKDNFRKTALARLPDEIKTLCIRSAPPNMLGYDGSQVHVDVHEFEKLVKPISEIKSLTTYNMLKPQLLKALELYQDHFLNGYTPAQYGLRPWIQEKRAALREVFHHLLEKLVQYEIISERYDQAFTHAERWHESVQTAELPLQYLIWLAANLDSYTRTRHYFNKLESLGSSDLRVIGYNAEEWRRLLTRGLKPEITVLRLNDIARIEVHDLLAIASQHLVGRNQDLEAIFETLFVTRSHSLLTITGERGIGKTTLAAAVATACKTADAVNRVMRVDVTAESSFEQVLNAIALQADKPHLLDMNYRSKYLSIEQLFEAENDLLILDQQETSDLFSEDFQTGIKALSKHAVILICCHDAWDGVHDIHLAPLDSGAAGMLFSAYSGTSNIEANADDLLAVTAGSPLALKLLVSSMNIRSLTLKEAAAQITDLSTGDAEFTSNETVLHYRRLLHWCWHFLDSPARQVLASLQDFDLLERPDLAELRSLHSGLSATVFDDSVRQLVNLSLVEINPHGEGRCYWHSLLHEFLWEINALSLATDDAHFKARIRAGFCEMNFDYLSQFAEDYPRLGLRQQNLIRAFNLSLEQEIVPDILTALNQFLPFLIRRDQYPVARRLAEQFEKKFQSSQSSEYVELQLNVAKLDIKQGEFQSAEIRLKEALNFCEARSETVLVADILQQLGIIATAQGQIDQAKSHHENALDFAAQHEQHELTATILANLGATNLDQGNYTIAKEQLENSLRIATSIQQLRIIEFTQTALGIVAMQELEFERALDYLTQAHATVNRLEYPERIAINFMNTGAALYYLGQYQPALENLQKSLEIVQRLEYDELASYLMRDLGRVHAALGNLLEAEHLYKRVLTMARSLRLGKLSTRSLLDIGKLYFQMHLWHDARKCYHSGLNEAVSSKDLGLIAEGLVGLGMTFAAESWLIGLNDIALSVTHLREGADADLMKKISELPLTALHLRKAEVFFQHGLRNFPHLDHYQIPAAWSALLQLGDTKDQGS